MNINTASREELERVAQIDGTRADYLVNYRRDHGAFTSWQEVEAVPSFDEGMVGRMKDAGFTIEREGEGQERSATEREGERERGGRESAGSRDLNTASAEDLEATHMIDGERAHRLVEYRRSRGEFTTWDDVKNVTGFDDGLVERLQEAGYRVRRASER